MRRLACIAALLVALALWGCGPDMLATTQQARDAQSDGAPSSQAVDAGEASAAAPSGAQPGATPDSRSSAEDAIRVTVELDTSNAAAYNGKYPKSLGTYTVDIAPGGTVLDALKATGVDVAVRGSGYVSAIGGIEERACGPGSGWMYVVDGTAPVVMSSDFELSGGETVRWAYTVVEGDVENYSM